MSNDVKKVNDDNHLMRKEKDIRLKIMDTELP